MGLSVRNYKKTAGIPDDIRDVVERHNHFLYTGSCDSPVEIALQAADSASGLIIACALVKGGHINDVSVKTITRKAKEKSFAAGCDRSRIALIAPWRFRYFTNTRSPESWGSVRNSDGNKPVFLRTVTSITKITYGSGYRTEQYPVHPSGCDNPAGTVCE